MSIGLLLQIMCFIFGLLTNKRSSLFDPRNTAE